MCKRYDTACSAPAGPRALENDLLQGPRQHAAAPCSELPALYVGNKGDNSQYALCMVAAHAFVRPTTFTECLAPIDSTSVHQKATLRASPVVLLLRLVAAVLPSCHQANE